MDDSSNDVGQERINLSSTTEPIR